MVTKRVIIGVVGMPASGKTLVAEQIVEKHKADRIHLGDFVWDYLKKRNIRPTEEMGSMVGLYLWVEYGDQPIIDWCVKQINKSKAKLIILDSLRTMEEAQFFREKYGKNFHLISVVASPTERYKRMKTRARFGKVTRLEFKLREKDELLRGAGDLIASSNHEIDGSKTKAHTKKQTDKIMKSIKGK